MNKVRSFFVLSCIESFSPNKIGTESLKRNGWCSWCFANTRHTLQRVNFVRRNVYQCDNCTMRTLGCLLCEDGMTRGGPTWDGQKNTHIFVLPCF